MKTSWLLGLLVVVIAVCIGLAKGLVAIERWERLERAPQRIDECARLCRATNSPSWRWDEARGCSCGSAP